MKVKSSVVLAEALSRIETKVQSFACAAIQDVETDMRFQHNENVSSKAAMFFSKYKPKIIDENMKATQPWWPKGDQGRIDALNNAIKDALMKKD